MASIKLAISYYKLLIYEALTFYIDEADVTYYLCRKRSMIRKLLLPIIALAGVAFSIFMIQFSGRKPPVSQVLFPPPTSPYAHYLAGDGIIESAYRNIPLGTSFDEIVTDVYVRVGDMVKKGQPLFKLDTRELEARLITALEEQQLAETDYHNQRIQFSFFERLKKKSAVSQQAYQAALYNKRLAKNRLKNAYAAVHVIKTNLDRCITTAPVDGEILQVNVRVGQSVNRVGQSIEGEGSGSSTIIFGDTSVYHLRIDINEEDAWRFIKGAKATAFMRGNADIAIPLEFVYVEPYMIPKRSLSGSARERVDTRVLQVVYKFSRDHHPVFIGQQLDVYLEAKANGV